MLAVRYIYVLNLINEDMYIVYMCTVVVRWKNDAPEIQIFDRVQPPNQ